MKKATREWLGKAEDDHHSIGQLLLADKPRHDPICFHCQQAAEKYLKALLEELGHPIPKTHDLLGVLKLLRPTYPGLGAVRRGLALLSRYAVAIRYPGVAATKRQAETARRWADRVREACRIALGLKPSPNKSP